MPIFPATQEDASSRPVWVYIVRIHLKKSGGAVERGRGKTYREAKKTTGTKKVKAG
jgi:hypothetical protein